MAHHFSWFSTNVEIERVRTAMKQLCAYAPRHEYPFYLKADVRGTLAIAGAGAGALDWAQRVSARVQGVAMGFMLLEGQWSMDVFDSGEHVLFLDSHQPLMEPLLGGDLDRGAGLIGTSPKVIKKYHSLLLNAFNDGNGDEFAFVDDEQPAADEWGHAELARRCTAMPSYQEVGDTTVEIFVGTGAIKCWADEFVRLDISVCAPRKVPRHLKFGTDQAQREALGWAEEWVRVSPDLALQVISRIRQRGVLGNSNRARMCWLEGLALVHRPQSRVAGIELALGLMREWLEPEKQSRVNQYLGQHEMRLLRESIAQNDPADPVLTKLLRAVEARGEPELIMGGDEPF